MYLTLFNMQATRLAGTIPKYYALDLISGLVGFMGNGDLWGLIFTHKSLSGFMGINGDLWIDPGQDIINLHKSP